MRTTRQCLLVIAFLLLIVNPARAVNQGVRDVVIDQRLKVIEIPIQAGGLTTFVFDMDVKQAFSPDRSLFKAEILEDLGLAHVTHPVLFVSIDKSVSPGTRANLMIMTDLYILSVRLRVTGRGGTGTDLVNVRTDLSSPAFAGATSKAPSSHTPGPVADANSTAGAGPRRSSPQTRTVRATGSRRAPLREGASVSVRVTDIQPPVKGDVYVAFELETPNSSSGAVHVRLTDVHGRPIANRVYWETSPPCKVSTRADVTTHGLLRIANADKLPRSPLTLTVSDPDGKWQVSVEGVQW